MVKSAPQIEALVRLRHFRVILDIRFPRISREFVKMTEFGAVHNRNVKVTVFLVCKGCHQIKIAFFAFWNPGIKISMGSGFWEQVLKRWPKRVAFDPAKRLRVFFEKSAREREAFWVFGHTSLPVPRFVLTVYLVIFEYCGALLAPENGQILQIDRRFLGFVEYSCDFGFEISVKNLRICQNDRIWNGSDPICEGECS